MNIKHFVNINDLSIDELELIINYAINLKTKFKSGKIDNRLENKTLAMVFDKPSTRTRISFEAGINQLGGKAIFLSNNDTQLGRGETITDSAKVISSMVDIIMLRISSHQDITNFANNSTKPVINALSDESHPCQMLADIMTIIELKGAIHNKVIAWIGDTNNMANTYAMAAKIFGFKLNIAAPKGYELENRFISPNIKTFNNPLEAAKNADIVTTDVFISMGQETEKAIRINDFKDFQVNDKVMQNAKNDALFMHCLPAHRGEEVSASVIDGKNSVVFQQAENRLHVQKALMLYLTNNL